MGTRVAAQSMDSVFLALLVPVSGRSLAHASRRPNAARRPLDVRQFRRLVHRLVIVPANEHVILVALIEAHALSRITERTRGHIRRGLSPRRMGRLFMFTRRVVLHVVTPTAGAVTLSVPRSLDRVGLLL